MTRASKSSRRNWVTILTTVIILLGILYSISYGIRSYISSRLNEIEGLHIEHVHIDPLRGLIRLHDVQVESLHMSGIHANVEEISLNGFKLIRNLSNDSWHGNQLIVEGSDIYIDLTSKHSSDTIQSKTAFPGLLLDEFALRNSTIHLIKDSNEVALIRDLHTRVFALRFISRDSIEFEDYFIKCGQAEAVLPSNPHQLKIANAEYYPNTKKLEINNLSYFSPISKDEWFHRIPTKKARIDLRVPRLEIHDLEVLELAFKNRLNLTKAIIKNAELEVFEDKHFDHCNTCIKPLLHEQLMKSDMDVIIDSLQVIDSKINYISREINQSNPGQIQFTNLYGSFYNMTNIEDMLRENPNMLLDVRTTVYDSAKLIVHFNFHMTDPNATFTYKGSTNDFDLTGLNQFLASSKKVEVGSGRAHQFAFDVVGNDSLAKGNVNFIYDNLEVDFYNNRGKKQKLLSNLINNWVVKSENLNGEDFRRGVVYFERDRSRSIFHLLSHSLQTGIQSSVFSETLLPRELKPE